jgi:hypothetical protein
LEWVFFIKFYLETVYLVLPMVAVRVSKSMQARASLQKELSWNIVLGTASLEMG